MPARPRRRPDSSQEPDRRPPVRGRTCAGCGAGLPRRSPGIRRGASARPPRPSGSPTRCSPRPARGRRAPAPRGRGDGIDPDRGIRGGSGRGLRRDAAAGGRAGCPDAPRGGRTQPRRRRSLQGTDPALAAQAAERAERLANEAYRLADDDFNDWDQGGPWLGPATGGGGGGDVAGAILGGILGGILSGGGTRRRRLGRFPVGWLRRQPAVAGSPAGVEAAASAPAGLGVAVAVGAGVAAGAADGEARSGRPDQIDVLARRCAHA